DRGFWIARAAPLDVIRIGIGRADTVMQQDAVEAGRPGVLRCRRMVVKLPDRARLIASVVKHALQKDFARVTRGVVDAVLVAVRVAAGEVTHARRHANRRLYEGLTEIRRARGEAVEIRRANEAVAVRAKT